MDIYYLLDNLSKRISCVTQFLVPDFTLLDNVRAHIAAQFTLAINKIIFIT